jgi:divalent metal cation (Fe/Co/Zn/Cd) transporter
MPLKAEQFFGRISTTSAGRASASVTTVLIAFGANLLVAVAKTVADVVTGSASIVAEATAF